MKNTLKVSLVTGLLGASMIIPFVGGAQTPPTGGSSSSTSSPTSSSSSSYSSHRSSQEGEFFCTKIKNWKFVSLPTTGTFINYVPMRYDYNEYEPDYWLTTATQYQHTPQTSSVVTYQYTWPPEDDVLFQKETWVDSKNIEHAVYAEVFNPGRFPKDEDKRRFPTHAFICEVLTPMPVQ